MKRFAVLFGLILTALIAFSQSDEMLVKAKTKMFSEEIIQKFDGTIKDENSEKIEELNFYSYTITIEINKEYDVFTVTPVIDRILNKYDDLTTIMSWEKYPLDTGHFYMTELDIANKYHLAISVLFGKYANLISIYTLTK